MTDMPSPEPEGPDDSAAIDFIHAAAFGPGRAARAAFRLREQGPHDPSKSFVMRRAGELVATVRMTPIAIGGLDAWLLGPLAVVPPLAGRGLGRRLLGHAVASVGAPVLLVGDLAYYGPFGFAPVSPARVLMPGPVDPRRLLVAGLDAEARERLSGIVMHRNRRSGG